MKAILVNYNFTPDWLLDSGLDYLIYDRSDSDGYLKDLPKERIIKTENVGNVDFDKLSYLVENYDQLPEFFLWGKTNLWQYTDVPLESIKESKEFRPLSKQDHRAYSDRFGQVCYYENGIYHERNDSWYLNVQGAKYRSFQDWAKDFLIPSPNYIPFAPGGNYVLTREVVHRYSRDYYARMRDTMPYCQTPGEAQLAERSYYLLWS